MDKFTFTSSDVWLLIEKALQRQRLALFDDLRTAVARGERTDPALIEGRIQSIDWVHAMPEILFPKEERASEKETSKKERW